MSVYRVGFVWSFLYYGRVHHWCSLDRVRHLRGSIRALLITDLNYLDSGVILELTKRWCKTTSNCSLLYVFVQYSSFPNLRFPRKPHIVWQGVWGEVGIVGRENNENPILALFLFFNMQKYDSQKFGRNLWESALVHLQGLKHSALPQGVRPAKTVETPSAATHNTKRNNSSIQCSCECRNYQGMP